MTFEAHYRVAYYYAFLDHTINHLNTRFPEKFEDALIATHLPANIANLSSENISKIRDEFEDVLPQPSQLQNEVTTWKVHIGEQDLSDDEKKSLLFTCTFAANNNMYYPNIYTILSLLLTLPVGSCSCERSFSSLRRLKTWCRNTTTNERLDALAIGTIRCQVTGTHQTCHRVDWRFFVLEFFGKGKDVEKVGKCACTIT